MRWEIPAAGCSAASRLLIVAIHGPLARAPLASWPPAAGRLIEASGRAAVAGAQTNRYSAIRIWRGSVCSVRSELIEHHPQRDVQGRRLVVCGAARAR